MRNTKRKANESFSHTVQVQPQYVRVFRDFVELPTGSTFDEGKGRILEAVRDNKRFIFCDVYHELPNIKSPAGNTVIVPVRINHFRELLWKSN